MDKYAVTERIPLGYALTVDGERVAVIATKHHQALPGFEDETCFAVEVGNNRAFGFTSEQDAWRFVTGVGELAFDVPDLRGVVDKDKPDIRIGLGVPDGLVKRFAADVETGRAVEEEESEAAGVRV